MSAHALLNIRAAAKMRAMNRPDSNRAEARRRGAMRAIEQEIKDAPQIAERLLFFLLSHGHDAKLTVRSEASINEVLRALPLWAVSRVQYRVLRGGIYSAYRRPFDLPAILGVGQSDLDDARRVHEGSRHDLMRTARAILQP